MSEALRGTRLGSTSYETDTNVEYAERQMTTYDCPAGHATTLPFSMEAEIPYTWECHTCNAVATLRNGVAPETKPVKAPRTHWDMLLERRSVDELEELLEERLEVVRAKRGESSVRRTA